MSDPAFLATNKSVVDIVEAHKIIQLRKWANFLDATIVANKGEDSCERVGNENEEVRWGESPRLRPF